MKNKTVKMLVVPAVGALILATSALGSSAFATDTPSTSSVETSTASSVDTSNMDNPDTSSSGEGDVSAVDSNAVEVQASLDGQLVEEEDAQAILGNMQVENIGDQDADPQVDEVNNDNNAEAASFSQDIADANQAGEGGDVAQLTESSSVVSSVTLPEVHAMISDDTNAHDLIAGIPTK